MLRQDVSQEILAVDTVPADELNTAVFFAVIEQQTIPVYAVAAGSSDDLVDPFGLFLGNSDHHRNHLTFVYIQAKEKAVGCPTACACSEGVRALW